MVVLFITMFYFMAEQLSMTQYKQTLLDHIIELIIATAQQCLVHSNFL